jgi:hypothetical protein
LFPAQLVLPVGNASVEGPALLTGPLANSDLTFQWVFSESLVADVPVGSTFTAIGFRLDAGQASGPGIEHVFSMWDLQLSGSLNSPGTLDPVFANNIAPDAVTVRSGPYTLPVNAFTGGAGPNEFFFLSFTTPYVYAGGDLLITLRQNGISGLPFLSLDAVPLSDLTGLADSVRGSGADAQSGMAQFSNVPVTALQYTAIPEPSSALLFIAALPLFVAGARYRLLRRR